MNKHESLKLQLKQHQEAIATIEAELQVIKPAIWVAFYEKDTYEPQVRYSEAAALKLYPSLVTRVVRYVLPDEKPESTEPQNLAS